MNAIHQRRLLYVILFVAGLALAAAFILYALKQNINAFFTPQQLSVAQVTPDYHIRLGGLVKNGSVVREKNSLAVQFTLTDFKKDIVVHYNGILPDLFREGKGAIAEGTLTAQGVFTATQVLAKHDENYMPKNVYKAMRENA